MDDNTKKQLGINEQQPTDWFENLYVSTNQKGDGVPWANMSTHPRFAGWLKENKLDGKGKKALVVGCGMGDDAIELEHLGFDVTAFDISESAIELCKRRFPDSKVNFVVADLLKGIPEWKKEFDFVLEIYTIQALPPKYEEILIQNLVELVASHGELLMITEVQEGKRDFEYGPPWLLNSDYIEKFESLGVNKIYHTSEDGELGGDNHLTIFKK